MHIPQLIPRRATSRMVSMPLLVHGPFVGIAVHWTAGSEEREAVVRISV